MAASSSECEIVQEEGDNGTDVKGEASTLLNKGKQTMVEGPGILDAFDGRMQALMIGCKKGLKKDRKSGKKVMMEWIEGHDGSKESLELVAIMKVELNKMGIRFLRKLSDFLFAVWNHEKGSENIERFKSALKWISEGVNAPVIESILTIVEMIDRGMSEMKRSKEARNEALKGKLPAALEETEHDGSNQKESSSGSTRLIKLGDPFFQDYMSRVVDKLLEASVRLEAIISHPTLPESGFSLTPALEYGFRGDLGEGEKAVESAVNEMEKMEITHPLYQVPKDVKMWQTQLSVEVEVYQLWRRVEFQASKANNQSNGCCLWCLWCCDNLLFPCKGFMKWICERGSA